MHSVLAYIYHYFLNNWQSIGVYLVSGAGIATVVKFLDKMRQWEKAGVKEMAVGVVSGLTALSNWIINNYATSPLASLGNVGPRLFISAVTMHRILVNPLTKKIEDKLFSGAGSYAEMRKEAAIYRAEQEAQKASPKDSQFV